MELHIATPATGTVTPAFNLSPAVTVGLDKALANLVKVAREELPRGTHEIDEVVTLRLLGTLKYGDDYQQKAVNKASPWGIVAVLLEELREKAIAAGESGIDLDKLVARSMALDAKIEKKAKEDADRIVKSLKADTWQTFDGKVTFSGSVEVI
jgi:hypothetical protein